MLNRSSHAVYDCRYHVVWCTWRRRQALSSPHEREYCEKVLRRVGEEYGMLVHALEVDIDHVHLYVEIPPQMAVGRAVGIFKSISARFMFKRFSYLKSKLWANQFWGASYFVRSVGEGVTAEMVKNYIKEHELKATLGSAQAELDLGPKVRNKK
jgi:putative transposase